MPTSQELRPATASRTLADLARTLGIPPEPAWAQVDIAGITLDSRRVRPGDLYVAILGEHTHGAVYARDAGAAGAVAIVTDPLGRERSRVAGLPVLETQNARAVLGPLAAELYGRPAEDLVTVGVTGTNGKTTTAFLLEAGLRAGGHRTGVLGTVATRIEDETLPAVRTTPEAPDLHALLAVMRERGVGAVAMEVSSHALDMYRVGGVVFDVALFTNLSHDHLDWHFTLESYFAAKAELFTPAHAAAGVVNLDDEHGRRLLSDPQIPLVSYSATGDKAADWRAVDVEPGPGGSSFTVLGPGGVRVPARVALAGAFNVANALGAVVALVTAGVPVADAVRGVGTCPGVPGRMERVEAGQPFLAVVDYAHTPDAVATLLGALRPVTSGRLILVLGAGGDRDRTKRPLMGQTGSRLADLLVLTDDNPRSEDPAEILAAVRAGATAVPAAEAAELVVEHDRAAAIALAVARARPGDTVVVAGKGHEQGQETAGVTRPFDDRTVLGDAMRAALGPVAAGAAVNQRGTDPAVSRSPEPADRCPEGGT